MFTSPARRCLASRTLATRQPFTTTRTLTTTTRLHAGKETEQDTAFDPQQTSPEEQSERASGAAKELTRDDTSPVDETANKSRDPQEGGATGSEAETGQGRQERKGQSGGGRPAKGSKV